jgi:menaquinone-9 beta-reductase
MIALDFDVAVVGAGSAGAAAALFLARSGWRVALLEARAPDHGGARWVDDVPPWMFDRAGLARPAPPEKRCDHIPFTMVGHRGDPHVPVGPRPMWGVDMRALTARLRAAAAAAGVAPFARVALERLVATGPRPTAVHFRGCERGGEPRAYRLAARLFVDATGARQALLRRVPPLAATCPPPAAADLCSAAQQVRVVTDRHGADAYLARHGVGRGHVLSFMGVCGGYSSLMVQVEPDGERVEVLAGLADGGASGSTGVGLLRALLAQQRWVGRVVFGGAGRIPLRRPYDRLAAEGIALIGDAACQVFPQHGSGVGAGLVAARLLADAVRGRDDPGSKAATWAYQAAFQRERGGVHAAYDLLRRATQRLDGDGLAALMAGGVVDAVMTRAALDQRIPAIGAGQVLGTAWRAARMPGRAHGLVAAAARMPLIAQLYAHYPLEPDERALRRWARAAAALCAHRPDVDATS